MSSTKVNGSDDNITILSGLRTGILTEQEEAGVMSNLEGVDIEQTFSSSEGRHPDPNGAFLQPERSIDCIGSIPSVEMATITDNSFLETFQQQTNDNRSDHTFGTIHTTTCTAGDGDGNGTVSSNIMDTTSLRPLDEDVKVPATSAKREEYSDDDEGAMKFQPLQPLTESKQAPEQTRKLRSYNRATAAQPITNASTETSGQDSSRASSAAASPENGFMNYMIDPVAATASIPLAASAASNASSLSHTPPANTYSSYEASHFAKRPRSGSLSERLLASSELEEKGIINRDQKGILKDLIISGQDNELQRALDLYEQGDSSVLESMLQTGTLSHKAAEEIDLLGDLNFDFLNVKEQAAAARSRGNSLASQPHGTGSLASDGIGELDFDGGIGNWEQGTTSRSRSNSTWSQLEYLLQQQQRSRANSTVSIDLDSFRQRSNSLFSSLLGNEPQDSQANYGRWMDPASEAVSSAGVSTELTQREVLLQQQQQHEQHFQQLLRRQQQQRQQQEEGAEQMDEEVPPRRKPGRRASAPVDTKPSKEELKAQKKKERLMKKEQKEREKREKKEKREQAKLDKQRKKEESQFCEKEKEREEHVPGSGRPRSMSDPNLNVSLDDDGLMHVERPEGWIGAYSPESRKVRIARFMEKRNHRVWTKTVKYDVRKNFADSRLRVKGRFVKKEDELLMRELMSLT
ncbi:CCT motif-containing protein [Nitzschia inconspicua]|uniref:CCT motif-containing protein n=1 Tax=Nitzschia inconspicua TaxID=303405 RepID=A0A9K3KT82_9STRA|nr:CCT motif-containing protein [Nitzschia inconspicua]